MRAYSQSGFSLVELSIVLVILGLLVGGVLGGQSLIRAAEVRAVATEFNTYQTAVYSFNERYRALPGDMKNATRFWGAEPAAHCPGDETTPSTGTATCDGDGDGRILWNGNPGFGAESHRFWQHLANAGMISGQYSGVHSEGACNTDGSCNVRLGWNAPASRIGGAGWSISSLGSPTQFFLPGTYGITYYYGSVGNYTTYPALTPAEAWSIDSKTDDGQPGKGKVRSTRNDYLQYCTDGNTAEAQYLLQEERIACPLLLITGF